jgi:hypothetical protein
MAYERNVLTSSLEIVWWLYEQRVRYAIAPLGDKTAASPRQRLIDLIGDLNNQILISFDDKPTNSRELSTLGAMAEAGWVRWLKLRREQGIPASAKKFLGIDIS